MEKNTQVQNESKAGNVQEKENNAKVIGEVEGRKQKVSASYTIRAFGENAKKLKEMGYISEEQEKTILEIKKEVGEKYMREELGI